MVDATMRREALLLYVVIEDISLKMFMDRKNWKKYNNVRRMNERSEFTAREILYGFQNYLKREKR